jgi:hypothetical protein
VNLPKKQIKTGPVRRPNALKHGAFSSIELYPWEDAGAFEQLRQELWEEHKPEGPSQDDCVETILWCHWRKLRLRERRKLETAAALINVENRVFEEQPPPLFNTELEAIKHSLIGATDRDRRQGKDENHRIVRDPAGDNLGHLLRLSESFYGDQSSTSVETSLMICPEEIRNHLEGKFPEAKFETTRQWIVALKTEIDSVLIPKARTQRRDPKRYWATAAKFAAADLMMEDLAVEERLDAAMDRALRRLFWLKTQKQFERDAAQKVINGKVK